MLHIKQIDAVSLRNITRQINAILSLSSFIKRQQDRSPTEMFRYKVVLIQVASIHVNSFEV